jgi:hypothetical protein
MSRRAQLACLGTGPLFGVLFILGAVLLARWVPPFVAPGDGPREVLRTFAEHADRIRIGTFLACIGSTLVLPWGLVVASQVRRSEGRSPLIAYVLIGCAAIASVILVLTFCIWGTAVFRTSGIDPQLTRSLNDLGYIVFLFTAPPFSLWAGALAFAIFNDDAESPVYPRWLGYLSGWVALLIMPAGLVIFFKSGAFAWNGLMTLYVPAVVFFAWLVAVTKCTWENIK